MCKNRETNLNLIKELANTLIYVDIKDTPFSPMVVKHPYTDSGIVLSKHGEDYINLDLINNKEDLKTWRKSIRNMINNSKDVWDIYSMLTKSYRMGFFKYAKELLSPQDYGNMLIDVWISTEMPNKDPNFTKRELVNLFKKVDRNMLMDDEEMRLFEQLDDEIEIYRGVTDTYIGDYNALSWTLDYEVAKWFANRFQGSGVVYSAKVNKENILAIFLGRSEKEVIVDPKTLTDVTERFCHSENMDIAQ